MAKLTQRDFEKLQNSGGLVVMTILRSFAPYFQNDTAGFPPKQALKLYEDGDAWPVDVPREAPEPTGLNGPQPARAPTRTRAAVTSRNVPTNRATQTKSSEPATRDVSNVRIPADWSAQTRGSTAKRLSLATRLSGKTAAQIKDAGGDEAAREIIQAEVDKRAGK